MKLITTCYKSNKKETIITEFQLAAGAVDGGMKVINLYPEVLYQTILGFGGALTEAASYSFSKLSKENQQKVLELYYGEDGNNYNMLRTHIDSSDFSLGNYSAMTDPEDREMKSFTLARDEQFILPMIRAAQEMKGEPIDIMLSPWSPPAFMKTNGEKNHGGKLKPEFREFYAEYICRYIAEYELKGFKVNRITIQNEPEAIQTWDSCIFSAQEEKEFLRDYLYPAMVKQGMTKVKINIWDHNKERMYERALATIDADTDKMIDGIAFHWYTGDHFDAVSMVRDAFPDKEIIFTEGCVEYSRFGTSQLQNAQMYAHDMIGNFNAGMTAFIDWNVLLDEQGGPNHVNNYCDAPVMCDLQKDEVTDNLSLHYIGHFSKYIVKGAKRIACTKYTDKLEMTAFKNPDGTVVFIILNRSAEEMPITLRINGATSELVIAGEAIATGIIHK